MKKSAVASTILSGQSRIASIPTITLWILIALALAGYILPWIRTDGTSLTLGAYDLAEWTSLHPSVRAGGYTTTLLLRLPLVFLALATGLSSSRFKTSYWLHWIAVLTLAIGALPPLEFFTQFQSDPNYQQKFALAVITLLGGLVGLILRPAPTARGVLLLMLGAGGICAFVGLAQSVESIRQFAIPIRIGAGGPVFILASASLVIFAGMSGSNLKR